MKLIKSVAAVFLLSLTAFAQTGIPVLGLSPSPFLNGMGGAGVALPTSDPFVNFANPAQIAANVHSNGVSAHFYPVKASLSDTGTVDLRASAATVGYRIPLRTNQTGFRIAIGYLNTDLDLGTQIIRDLEGNIVRTTIASEYYYSFSLAFAVEYKVLVGFGVTYKWVTSERGFIPRADGTFARLREDRGVFDYGVIAALPVYDLLFEPGRNFKPFLGISGGFSKTNIGDDVTYNGEIDPLPLPKTTRLGYAVTGGLNMKMRDYDLNLIRADWTAESLDPVTGPEPGSTSGLPFSGYFSGTHDFVATKSIRAYHIRLLETVSYQHGTYQTVGAGEKASYGFGITSTGVFKLIRPRYTRNLLSFIFEQIELGYYQSWYYASSGPENRYYGVNIRVGGF